MSERVYDFQPQFFDVDFGDYGPVGGPLELPNPVDHHHSPSELA